jgi:hypothetical protein
MPFRARKNEVLLKTTICFHVKVTVFSYITFTELERIQSFDQAPERG